MLGWKFLTRIGNFEIWKTQSKYLVCYKIKWIFVFTDTYQEAFDKAHFLQDKLIEK